jgi:hypothetical protein
MPWDGQTPVWAPEERSERIVVEFRQDVGIGPRFQHDPKKRRADGPQRRKPAPEENNRGLQPAGSSHPLQPLHSIVRAIGLTLTPFAPHHG